MEPNSGRQRSRLSRKSRLEASKSNKFSYYLSFGLPATACIACFLSLYLLILTCLLPMLHSVPQHSLSSPLEGARLPHAPGQERIAYAASVGQENIAEAVSAVRSQIRNFRQGHGVTDESLLKSTEAEFRILRAQKRAIAKTNLRAATVSTGKDQRHGFVVLGMHRSGTSLLSGLLVTGMGYNVGGPLIGAAFDNEKGFFERVDVVLQNDEFLAAQKIGWAYNVISYDADKALQHKNTGSVKFLEGKKGLKFLNDPANAPWLQKDPRMCITLPTWLKLLRSEPAVVFTYRHPLEVARSLNKREANFGLDRGLRLWIVYNMRAIQNSQGLCRVVSSNEAILANPLKEVQRISDEISATCGVPRPPGRLDKKVVDQFVDPKLHHNKLQKEEEQSKQRILADYEGCIVRDFDSGHEEETEEDERIKGLYRMAMKVYCDFQNGAAYKLGYDWPKLR